MRDIKKADKFDKAVERLNDQKELESVKSKKSCRQSQNNARRRKLKKRKFCPLIFRCRCSSSLKKKMQLTAFRTTPPLMC